MALLGAGNQLEFEDFRQFMDEWKDAEATFQKLYGMDFNVYLHRRDNDSKFTFNKDEADIIMDILEKSEGFHFILADEYNGMGDGFMVISNIMISPEAFLYTYGSRINDAARKEIERVMVEDKL